MTSIGSYAFENCQQLVRASFPKATSVPSYAFRNCASLQNIYFSVATVLANYSFASCGNLAIADFPRVTTINPYAFNGCRSLTALALRRSAAIVSLSNVNALAGTPIEGGEGYIYVPSALLSSYQIDSRWKTFANQFRALEGYTVDGTITGELDKTKI